MTKKFNKQRTDLLQTVDDFERVMEDYFGMPPFKLELFKLDRITYWEYEDVENSLTLHFRDIFDLDELVSGLMSTPDRLFMFEFEEYKHVDRENLTLTIIGRMGGLK
jgi:hypothetical protein